MPPKAVPCLVVAALLLFVVEYLEAEDKLNQQVNQFLQDYGYYAMTVGSSEEAALKLFQKNYGLNETGEADDATVAKMRAPRCGNPDMITNPGLDFPIWTSNKLLSYTFVMPTQKNLTVIPLDQLQQTFDTAFSKWAQHSVFEFQEVPVGLAEADIQIGFFNVSPPSDDDNDPARRALAFVIMEPPPSLHLNAAVNWSTAVTGQPRSGDEMDLESVAVHEIGDMLGLRHRMNPESVMYAGFSLGVTKRELVQQDIDAIRALYPN